MKKTSTLHKFTLALAAAAFCMSAQAHDAWVEAKGADFAVIYGHPDHLEGYNPAKVKTLAAFDTQGAALAIKKTNGDKAVTFTVDGKPGLIVLYYDNGFWTKTTKGMKNVPKTEVSDAISGSHIVKFNKTVFDWSAYLMKPQGQRLEVVPLTDKAPVAGQTLTVQVLWEGKPLSGAMVQEVEGPEGAKGHVVKTDADGKATVPVKVGQQTVSTSHKAPISNDPRAETYGASANLVFNAK